MHTTLLRACLVFVGLALSEWFYLSYYQNLYHAFEYKQDVGQEQACQRSAKGGLRGTGGIKDRSSSVDRTSLRIQHNPIGRHCERSNTRGLLLRQCNIASLAGAHAETGERVD
jgi:hypothetical protein